MVQILFDWIRKSRMFFRWIWRHEGSPSQCARGVAVGVFSGCFPFFGLQTLMGVSLASVFKGNHLLAAAGTWISNPFTYVPLFWLNYKIGCLFLGKSLAIGELVQISRQELWDQGWIFSSRILLGSSIVGGALGMLLGLISYKLFQSPSRNRRT